MKAIVTSNDETTADEPQRIDLTQFAGTTPGPWTNAPLIGTIVQGVRAGKDASERAFDGNDPDYQALFLIPDLLAELKRMYEREDALMKAREIWLIEERRLEKKVEVSQKEMRQSLIRTSDIEKALRKALRIIRDDLDEVTSSPINEVEKDKLLKKIRNFANDASQ